MATRVLNRRLSRRAFWTLRSQDRRRKRTRGAGVLSFEDYLLANLGSNLRAFYPLAYDVKDAGPAGNHAYTVSGVTFSGPTPAGFGFRNCAAFDGAASQVRLENTTYPLGTPRWTISCWFKKTGAGVTTSTAGGADGFPSTDPVVPLVTKGRGEAEGSTVDCNWFLGLNKVSNGATYRLAGDFEDMASGGNHRILGTTDLADGQWYHAAFTFDGSASRLYLNGSLEATVTTSAVPRSDSIQKAGIGTAYTSAAAAGGFFAGQIAGVAIWSEALGGESLAALYARGTASLRKTVTFLQGATDNLITSGANFVNWLWDGLGSSAGAGGITLVGASGNYALIAIGGLVPSTDYWCRCVIAAKSGSAVGPLRVAAVGTMGSTLAGVGGAAVNIGSAVGTFYFRVRSPAASGAQTLVVEHAGSAAGETFRFSEFNVFGIPARSAAKLAILGDRCGNFDAARGAAVDSALLDAGADTVNVVSVGDLADSSNSYAAVNGTLLAGISARSGVIVPNMGNHDYDGANEGAILSYFGASGYNAGKTYFSVRLGEMEFFVFDDENDLVQQPDNGNGVSGTASACQCSLAGQHVLMKLARSTAKWPVFIFHHPAYTSSGSGPGTVHARWDWAGLGVPLILQGHCHGIERLLSGNATFYTAARGGCDHHGWNATIPETQWRVADTALSGYLKIYDSPSELVLEFYDTAQNLLDRFKVARVES